MRWLIIALFTLLPLPLMAEVAEPHCTSGKWSGIQCIDPMNFSQGVCQIIETQATDHGLDPAGFARLIWQESRFNPNALSPANAMGIAQFIAPTAKARGLTDPYDPALALEHSAQYLGEMTRHYVGFGLAAAAYNAGEGRVDDFLYRGRRLPGETRNYVRVITGASGDAWKANPKLQPDYRLNGDQPFLPACLAMARDRVYTKLFRPVPVPGWGVQMAYGTTRGKAKAAFNRRAKQCRGALRGTNVHYLRVKTRASGPRGFYVARLGASTRQKADALCRKVARSGCKCRVYRNK